MQTTSGKFQMSRFWLDVKKKKRKNVSIKKNSQSIFPLPLPLPQNRWLLRARVNWPNSTQNLQIPRYSDTTGRVTGLYCNTNKNRARGRERINAGERKREWEGERNSRCLATDPRHGVIHFGEVSLYAIYPLPPSPLLHTLPRCTPANSSLPCRCTQTIDAPDYWPTNVRGDLILNQSTAVSRLIYNQPWFESFVAPRVLQTPHAAALNENILIDCRITIAGLSLKIRGEGEGAGLGL